VRIIGNAKSLKASVKRSSRSMKAVSVLLSVILLHFSSCTAQKNQVILDYFQRASAWGLQDFIFTTPELIELCKDSVNIQKLEEAVTRVEKAIGKGSRGLSVELALSMKILWGKVTETQIDSKQDGLSKVFLEKRLSKFNVPLEVTEELVETRFSADEDLTFCTACTSMYIFLIHDPELYIRVRSKEDGFISSQVHFPNAYILQDCNRPIELMKRIQGGLLARIEKFDDPLLKKVYTEIENCDLSDRCN
jgi:hypothetical protein